MDLRDYVRILGRRWWLVAVVTLLGVAVGTGVTLASAKTYQASVQLFVSAYADDSVAVIAEGNSFAQAQVQSYTSLVTDPRVLGPVATKFGRTVDDMANNVSADAPTGKVLINLHVTDSDPGFAAKFANSLADQFANVVSSTAKRSETSPEVVKLTVIHPASPPSAPIQPQPFRDIGLGLVLGLLVGICAALVVDRIRRGPPRRAETA